ncbi:unnamed protein product [Trifolium pratense]|uniref:Uncharacterized protein n=1 Tax=Trifolium pratense TaxID=57577 RepID=A0ACB0MCV0_TRIPR|nr:unnamed protein product [Trifolium pratense]
MTRPSPPRTRKQLREITSGKHATTKKVKMTSKTTTTSVQTGKHYSEKREETVKKNYIDLSSSRYNSSRKLDESDDDKDYESTASTPKLDRKRAAKKKAATATRPTKPDIDLTKGNASAPAKIKLKFDGPSTLDDFQYDRITRKLFCQPEQDDDNDFYLNYHPISSFGYEGADVPLYIPEWMPMTFRPARKMCLNDICTYTAAYVFMRDDEKLLGSLPDSNEVSKDFPAILIGGVDATVERLDSSNIFFIAKRKNANQDVFYFSAKLPQGIPLLVELTTVVGNPVSNVPSRHQALKCQHLSSKPSRLSVVAVSSHLHPFFLFYFF